MLTDVADNRRSKQTQTTNGANICTRSAFLMLTYKWAYLSIKNINFFRHKPHKKWRNLHKHNAILLYPIYANLLTDNIFRAVSSLTPHALEKLFTDQDYLGFHAMNFPHRNPTLLEAHAPKYLVFFKWRAQIFRLTFLGKLPGWKLLRVLLNYTE